MPGLPLLQLKNEEVNNITPTYIYAWCEFLNCFTFITK